MTDVHGKSRGLATGTKLHYARGMEHIKSIASEQEWREFEVECWAAARRLQGLCLSSLDTEQQRALVDHAWRSLRGHFSAAYLGCDS